MRGSDLMVVNIVANMEGTPRGSGSYTERIILPDSIVYASPYANATPFVNADELAAAATDNAEDNEPDLYTIMRLPLGTRETLNRWWAVERTMPLATAAGSFDGCIELTEIFNAANRDGHWLCPGVGIVRRELPGCTSGGVHGNYGVWELIEWSVPPLRAVR